ncbi:MAG: hypothetical protein ACYSUY_01995 [Planctomycetota bacterium]|jgi:hypothetical protein
MQDENKVAMTDISKTTIVVAIMLIAALPSISYGAGHFTLAFQRQIPAWENNAGTGCQGELVCRVWIWDEDGNPVPNIQLKIPDSNDLKGVTDIDGRAQITIEKGDFDDNKDIDLKCVDGQGATSDITRIMTTFRPECWGHYSFQVGFLYKTDASNPGEFDLDLNCTWNERAPAPQDDDAPYTKSLAYNGVDCTDYWSDQSDLGNWQDDDSYFGQTFVATGDRVVAARIHGTIGGLYLLDWNLQIVTFPDLQPVGPNTVVPYRWNFGWEAFWGVDECPVVPGQTYMLQVWRGGGMNVWRVEQDVYPNGQYYEGTTAFPGFDLNGHICCMNYGPQGPDLNRDRKVNFKDVSILALYLDSNEPSVDIGPPPLGDGTINYKDLAVIVENWLIATTIPPLPGPASNIAPVNGATDVDPNADLNWTAGAYATSHDVFFGTSNPPPFVGNQTDTIFEPGTMAASTTHYWRIDAVNVWGTATGTVWSFTTLVPDHSATNPNPYDGETGVSTTADLSWTADPEATSHDVYFGTSNPPPFMQNKPTTTFDPGTMASGIRYYWRINEVGPYGTITGPVWRFNTQGGGPG